jgi:hypothetical protein
MAIRNLHLFTAKRKVANSFNAQADKRRFAERKKEKDLKPVLRTKPSSKEPVRVNEDVKLFASSLGFASQLNLDGARRFADRFAETKSKGQVVDAAKQVLANVSRDPAKYKRAWGSGFATALFGLGLLVSSPEVRADTMPGAVPLARRSVAKNYTEGSQTGDYLLTRFGLGLPIGMFGDVNLSSEFGVKRVQVGNKVILVPELIFAGGNKVLQLALGTGFDKSSTNNWFAGIVYSPTETTKLSIKGFGLQKPDKFWGSLMAEQAIGKYFSGIAEYIQMGLKDAKNMDVQLGGRFNVGQFSENPYLNGLSVKALADITQKYGITEFNIDHVIPAGPATVIVSIGYQMKKGPDGLEHYGNLFLAVPFGK